MIANYAELWKMCGLVKEGEDKVRRNGMKLQLLDTTQILKSFEVSAFVFGDVTRFALKDALTFTTGRAL